MANFKDNIVELDARRKRNVPDWYMTQLPRHHWAKDYKTRLSIEQRAATRYTMPAWLAAVLIVLCFLVLPALVGYSLHN